MDQMRPQSTAELRQLFNIVANKTSTLKVSIEGVQCIAIDAELSLMDGDISSANAPMRRAQKQIAEILGDVLDELTALLHLIRLEPTKPGRPRLQ